MKVQTFVIMQMITLYLQFGKNFDEVIRKLQNDFLILDEWLFDNILVRNSDKCHFMTLGTPNQEQFLRKTFRCHYG